MSYPTKSAISSIIILIGLVLMGIAQPLWLRLMGVPISLSGVWSVIALSGRLKRWPNMAKPLAVVLLGVVMLAQVIGFLDILSVSFQMLWQNTLGKQLMESVPIAFQEHPVLLVGLLMSAIMPIALAGGYLGSNAVYMLLLVLDKKQEQIDWLELDWLKSVPETADVVDDSLVSVKH